VTSPEVSKCPISVVALHWEVSEVWEADVPANVDLTALELFERARRHIGAKLRSGVVFRRDDCSGVDRVIGSESPGGRYGTFSIN